MKKFKSIILTLIAALFANVLFAQLDRSIQPQPGPAPEFKIGEHKTFTLDNGLKVIVVENHKTPRVSYQLTIDVNPVFEKDAKGYVSMAGDLLRSGTNTKLKVEIDEAIDFIGADLYTFKNGMYGMTLTKHKTTFLELMSDILLDPSYPKEEVEKTKKQQLAGLASSKTNPNVIANRVGQKLRNQQHPYGEIETESTIEKITRDHLVQYYNTYYKPNVSYLVIVGDISLKEAKKDAEKYFGSWKKGDVPKQEYQFPNKNIGTRVALVHKDDAVQSYVNITYPVNLKIGGKDAISGSIANNILGSGTFSSRLLSNLREDKGYTYGAYSSLSKNAYVGNFRAFAQVGTEVTDDAVNQFIIEMNRMKNEVVDTETLSLFKTILTGSFARSLEDPQTIARFAFNSIKYDLPEDYYQTYLEKIDEVTKEQVQVVSKKYIDANQAIIVVIGDKNKLYEDLKKYSSTGEVEIYDINGNPVKEESGKALPEGIDANVVIEKYVNAIGGKEALEKIQDIKMTATTSMNGMELKQTTYKKAPNMYAMIMSMNGNVMMQQAFNGERGIMKTFQGENEIIGDDLENLKIDAVMNAELKYSEIGVVVTLEAIEPVNESDAYKLKIVNPTGQTTYDYFDVESGLKVQSKQTSVTPQGEFTQVINYTDYQEINSVKFPFSIKISGVQNMELKVSSVEINTDLSDDLF
ncbi:MAG: insulinase family protein [Bacteroidales bacterium]|nr:insulinase family protein [Bacteroidales bacterium]